MPELIECRVQHQLKVHPAVCEPAQVVANLPQAIRLKRAVDAPHLIDELGNQIHRRQDHHQKGQKDRDSGADARPLGTLQDVPVDGKQSIGKDAGQHDVPHERQHDDDAQDGDTGKQKTEEDAFLPQLSLP